MVAIHLIFWLLILSFNGAAKRVADDETLKKLLKELIESNNSKDDQVIVSGALDLAADEDINSYKDDFGNKNIDGYSRINDDYNELNNHAELSLPMCGKPEIEPDINQRIVNGKPVRPHSWPWQVFLHQLYPNGTCCSICGGSIISNNIVLTAAHCLTQYTPNMSVAAGLHNLHNNGSESTQESKIANFKIHDQYFYNETQSMNDIAVLIMDKPFTFNDKISPVCLPKKGSIASGMCYATGWGNTNGTGDRLLLRQIRLPIVDNHVCAEHVAEAITEQHLCAGLDDDKGACHGDSGGPFVCLDTQDNKWYLQGISNFVASGCGKMTVFAKVVYFLDWIREHTGLPIE